MQSSSPPWRRRSVELSLKKQSLPGLAVGSEQRKPNEDVVCNGQRHELCFPPPPQKDPTGSSKKIVQVFWLLVEGPTRPSGIGAFKALLEDPTRDWDIAQSWKVRDSNLGLIATALRKHSRRCRKTSFFIDP